MRTAGRFHRQDHIDKHQVQTTNLMKKDCFFALIDPI
jgi:hypothetical protein